MRRTSRFLVVGLALCALAQAETILVLPFFNLSKNNNLEWVGDSLSEALTETLAGEGLNLVKPELRDEILRQLSVRRYAVLTRATVMELATNLDAGVVIYGDFNAPPAAPGAKQTLQVNARVLDVRKLHRGPEFQAEGALEDLSSLQNRLNWQVLSSLLPDSAPSQADFSRAHPPVRTEALENYIRALRTNSTEQKLRLLATAARLEPAFAQPRFQLGRLNYIARSHRVAAEWFDKVAPSDMHYREALFLLALSRYRTGEFRKSAEAGQALAASMPLPEVLNNTGAALLRCGDLSALDWFLKALDADSADPEFHFNVGYVLWRRGDYKTAAQRFRSVLERRPQDEQAAMLLERCESGLAAKPGDLRTEGLERVKTEFNESAWLALKAMLGGKLRP